MSDHSLWFGSPLSFRSRVWLLAASFALVAGFGLARWLEPDPRGFGTHQKLGLPECTFQLLWKRPCPGCGMTTAFAHFVRGEWRAAARANPGGLLLGLTCAVLIPWLWLSALVGRTVGVSSPLNASLALLVALAVVTMGVWIGRMADIG